MQPDERPEPEDETPQDDAPQGAVAPQRTEGTPEQAPAGEPEKDAGQGGVLSGVRGWFDRILTKPDERELSNLELRTRLLDEVERALKPHRTARPLPFNRLTVHILAPGAPEQRLYESAINHLDPPFEQAVRHRLQEAGFDVLPALNITTRLYKESPEKLARAFEASGPVYVEPRERAARVSAMLTIVKGKAEEDRYRIDNDAPVTIGRLRDVVEGSYGRVVRHNDVAFLDPHASGLSGEDAACNETVSRRHARIAFDARAGAFQLYNEEGSTTVSRQGYPRPVRVGTLPVPLQHGDLIYLGRACLRFETRRR